MVPPPLPLLAPTEPTCFLAPADPPQVDLTLLGLMRLALGRARPGLGLRVVGLGELLGSLMLAMVRARDRTRALGGPELEG